jgi:hypothetical protein
MQVAAFFEMVRETRPTRMETNVPKLCELPQMNLPPIYVNPALVRLIREGGDGVTVIDFEEDHRVSISLHIDRVRELLDQAMSSMAPTRARR